MWKSVPVRIIELLILPFWPISNMNMTTWPFEPHVNELGMAQSLQVVDWDKLKSINLFKSSCKYYLDSFLRNIELTDLKCIDLNMYYIMFFRWWNHLLCKVYLTLRNGSSETFFQRKNFQTKKKIFNQWVINVVTRAT